MTKSTSKTLRQAGAVVLSLAMALSVVGVAPTAEAAAKKQSTAATKITPSKKKVSVKAKKTSAAIKLTINKKATKKVTINVKSSNKKVATVTKSKVTVAKGKKKSGAFKVKGVKKGSANVVASLKNSKGKTIKATIKVTVTKAADTPTPTVAPAKDLTGATQIVLSSDGTKLWVVKDGVLTTIDLAASGLTPDQIKAGGTFNLKDAQGNDVTLTLTADEAAKIATSDTAPEVGAADVTIESVRQIKADEFEVTFANVIASTEDVDITIKNGTTDVKIDTVTWDATFKVATVKTAAKLAKGTYTITATSKKDATKTSSKDVQVDDAQKVVEITFLNDTALTGKGTGQNTDKLVYAYAYYDVVDQFGESMRASTSIQWSGSAKITANKTNGQLKLEKTDGNAWVYGDKIYITGVYTKTGVANSKELTVGAEQALDTVEMKGFVKKGTTEILQALPKDFKGSTYYLLYNALDQNGNPMDAVASYDASETQVVTFVSDNVLVIKEIQKPEKTPVVIEGVEYEAAFVEPGIKVADGGEVTVTAIANKTGKKNTMKFVVGVDSVITSFALGSPSGVVADGDTVTIPFTAKDAEGNEITDFETIAKQETFNTLSLNASEGTLTLAQQNDGSAKLVWADVTKNWSDSQTTDGIDRPVSLTSVVVGGSTDNEMLSVSDKRRPNAIADVKTSEVYLEGASVAFDLDSFTYYDQYGELIGSDWGDGSGFFEASYGGTLSGSDFNGYAYGVKALYAGSQKMTRAASSSAKKESQGSKNYNALTYDGTTKTAVTYDAATDIKSVANGEGFKFEIAKIKSTDVAADKAEEWEAVSSTKYIEMSIVDISQVKNIKVAELDKLYLGKVSSVGGGSTGEGVATGNITNIEASIGSGNVGSEGLKTAGDYQKKLTVTGEYNGKAVSIPASYYEAVAENDKLQVSGTASAWTISDVGNSLKLSDIYSNKDAKPISKDGSDKIKASVKEIYTNKDYSVKVGSTTYTLKAGSDITQITTGGTAVTGLVDANGDNVASTAVNQTALRNAIDPAYDGTDDVDNGELYKLISGVYDTASVSVSFSDQTPAATKFAGLEDAYTFGPDTTEITMTTVADTLDITVLDQYGVEISDSIKGYKVTGIEENKAGYADNNFKTTGNDSTKLAISGAERGDTFTLVITAGNIEESTKVTVGADARAIISGSQNTYRETLLKELESQRAAGLN